MCKGHFNNDGERCYFLRAVKMDCVRFELSATMSMGSALIMV